VDEHLHVTANCPRRYLLLYRVAFFDTSDGMFGIISELFGRSLAAACIDMQTIEQSACVGQKERPGMRFLISSLDGLYSGAPSTYSVYRVPCCSLNMEEDNSVMSEGMRIFETVTGELQSMHNDGNLKNLGQVSSNYYWAGREIERLHKELAAALSKEDFGKIIQLQDYLTNQETMAGEIFYNQGFADGMSLVMQSAMWEAVRR
jgi:hypothetical protein